MQACNLQNLPENYTMKYCTSASVLLRIKQKLNALPARLVSRFIVAKSIIRGGGPQRSGCWIHTCKNVSFVFSTSLTPVTNGNYEPREEDLQQDEEPHGHVTSISVIREYRRLGIAKKLMLQSRTSIPFRFCGFND